MTKHIYLKLRANTMLDSEPLRRLSLSEKVKEAPLWLHVLTSFKPNVNPIYIKIISKMIKQKKNYHYIKLI